MSDSGLPTAAWGDLLLVACSASDSPLDALSSISASSGVDLMPNEMDGTAAATTLCWGVCDCDEAADEDVDTGVLEAKVDDGVDFLDGCNKRPALAVDADVVLADGVVAASSLLRVDLSLRSFRSLLLLLLLLPPPFAAELLPTVVLWLPLPVPPPVSDDRSLFLSFFLCLCLRSDSPLDKRSLVFLSTEITAPTYGTAEVAVVVVLVMLPIVPAAVVLTKPTATGAVGCDDDIGIGAFDVPALAVLAGSADTADDIESALV